jgi:uncharacterized protein (TIGR02996 family)
MTSEENGFLLTLKKNPDDSTAHSAYADWLDEHDRHYEAILQRDKAGVSEVWFKLRRKSDGLFSEGRSTSRHRPVRWSAKGKMWRRLSDLRSHMANMRDSTSYGNTPWTDLEVVVIEIRTSAAAVLPILVERDPTRRWAQQTFTIVEPLGEEANKE